MNYAVALERYLATRYGDEWLMAIGHWIPEIRKRVAEWESSCHGGEWLEYMGRVNDNKATMSQAEAEVCAYLEMRRLHPVTHQQGFLLNPEGRLEQLRRQREEAVLGEAPPDGIQFSGGVPL